MHFTVIANPRAQHQLSHQLALADGLRSWGAEVSLSHYGASTRHVACWGWRKGKALRDAGHEVLVIERGYLGDRFTWTSLAWNGLNGRGTFGAAQNDGGDRFHEHFAMRPWKQGGDYVLIMGQVPGDASLQGRNMMPWYEESARQAAKAYGLPVQFRPHPLAARKGHRQSLRNAVLSTGDLEEALDCAAVVITFNSNSGVDAVLAGVPTVAVDPGSMAWSVSGHAIGDMLTPCRDQWAHELAWKQWSIDEIASGVALNGLLSVARD